MKKVTKRVSKKGWRRHCPNPTCDFYHVRPNGRAGALIPRDLALIPEQHRGKTLLACGYCDAVWIVGVPAPGRMIGRFGWREGEHGGERVFWPDVTDR